MVAPTIQLWTRAPTASYFEWFLRGAYGVKLLPTAGFTRALGHAAC
jgi:hypothetical protein